MSGYEFRVYDIDWEEGVDKTILPNEAVVRLPDWLVEADSLDDDEWDEAITEELLDRFSALPLSYSFEPHERVDDEE